MSSINDFVSYSKDAKQIWGETEAYKEYEKKAGNRSKEDNDSIMKEFMDLFVDAGKIKDADPSSDEAQSMVKKLKDFITEHFYTCTDEILSGLGKMYASGNVFTVNIDNAGGKGTATFVSSAIEEYCK